MDYDNPCNPHCDASPKALILSDIWFADGNIILIANSATFKVHHGQLERHLEVFRDLFSVPQPIDQNLVDGCPSVELHDRLSDLYHLLIALYDGIYFTKHTSADFIAIAAVLRLSTKYFIEHLRERCIARLAIDWPTSLPQWDRRENDGIDHGGRYNPRETLPHPILMLKLACELFTAFPSLLRLPSWLPGMHVKRDILETPFARMVLCSQTISQATGTVSSSMVSDHLRALDESDSDSAWQKKAVRESAATAFGGEHISFSVIFSS
ncbi:hypothetical protein DFH29DRAFT_939881 [Suillus ampliporus]|nr:hypothetical protein DFH29DRAFT_939881 [Suillus ampliporus]